jgi:hypothetical protein
VEPAACQSSGGLNTFQATAVFYRIILFSSTESTYFKFFPEPSSANATSIFFFVFFVHCPLGRRTGTLRNYVFGQLWRSPGGGHPAYVGEFPASACLPKVKSLQTVRRLASPASADHPTIPSLCLFLRQRQPAHKVWVLRVHHQQSRAPRDRREMTLVFFLKRQCYVEIVLQ